MKKILLLIFLLSFNSFAKNICKITSYPHIVQIESNLSPKIISESNCSPITNAKIIHFLSNTKGKLNASILTANIDLDEDIVLEPTNINIHNINHLLNAKLSNKNNLYTNVISTKDLNHITSNSTHLIYTLKCNHCNNPGQKTIQFIIDKRTYWLKSNLKNKISVYRAKQALPYMSPLLDKNDFEKITKLTDAKIQPFTDMENIQYYKLTKNIQSGEILKTNNIIPKKLISRGQKVRIYINNKLVKLSTIGVALKAGTIGEYIEVQNPKSKKTNLAKIIDYNKVHIEL